MRAPVPNHRDDWGWERVVRGGPAAATPQPSLGDRFGKAAAVADLTSMVVRPALPAISGHVLNRPR